MKLILAAAALLAALPASAQITGAASFDADWRFAKGDLPGGDNPTLTDTAWQKVSLPHDWAIAGPFDEKAPAGGAQAFLPSGVAWYRKHFALPAASRGKRVFVEFDGVMERASVWINGHQLGTRPNGYASFRYELTPHLKAGENVIAVRADTSNQPASRFYAGGGIYRHVRLITVGDVYADSWGTAVRVDKLDANSAQLSVTSEIVNRTGAAVAGKLEAVIIAPNGRTVATLSGAAAQLVAGQTTPVTITGSLANPRRWDIADPALHTALVRLRGPDGAVLYEERVPFGIRDARFVAESGFWLNGHNIKLKGAAIHADGGPFGMAVPLSFYERRLKGLKALGVNAIRTAHHPFSAAFMDLCDRMGMLVMDEAFDMWTVAKNKQDYHLFFNEWSSADARDFARRDRNHPSVILWSIGNEIHDTPKPEIAQPIMRRLIDIFHKEDPTRPVTQALFRPNVSKDYDNGTADLLDVVGQNYRENELAKAHADKPTRKIVGTENTHSREGWLIVRDNPAYSGMFLWTGADYLGEAFRWPAIAASFGLVDRIDQVKAQGWERASWWAETPVLKIARRVGARNVPAPAGPAPDPGTPAAAALEAARTRGVQVLTDWTPDSLAAHDEAVEIYSNVPEVELFLNGKSLGRKPRDPGDRARAWTVPFAPGELRAVGYRGGAKVAEDVLRTAGAPVAVRAVAERTTLRPGFDDVAAVRLEVVDARGVVVPNVPVTFAVTVTGPGTLAALDNGSLTDHTVFASPTREALRGKAVAFVRASGAGNLTIMATAKGLKPARATIATAR